MNPESLSRSLQQHPFFSGLSPSDIEFLTGCTKNCRFEKGEYLFREGQPADSLYLLRQGFVDLECYATSRGPIALERLCPGEALGVSIIFSTYQWPLDARATSAVLAFAIDGACLRTKIEQDPVFGCAVLRHLLHDTHVRLERARLHQLDVYKSELVGADST